MHVPAGLSVCLSPLPCWVIKVLLCVCASMWALEIRASAPFSIYAVLSCSILFILLPARRLSPTQLVCSDTSDLRLPNRGAARGPRPLCLHSCLTLYSNFLGLRLHFFLKEQLGTTSGKEEGVLSCDSASTSHQLKQSWASCLTSEGLSFLICNALIT